MTSFKKLEVDVEIQAPAHLFYDVMTYRPHSLNTMAPDKIQNCSIQSGEEGTVLCFDYIHDGKKKTVKDIREKTDDKNLSTTWKVIEGDIMGEYKSFKFGLQVTPSGSGSLVHWTLEYEKINEDTPDPHSLLEFCVHCTKGIDAYLVNAQLNNA